MSNLVQRTITGVFFVLLIVMAILAGHIYFSILFLFVNIFGLWEFFTLIEKKEVNANKFAGIATGTFLFASNALIALEFLPREILYLNFLFIFLIFLYELYRKNEHPFTNIAFTFFGILYVAVPFSLLNYFPNPGFISGEYLHQILIGFFILVWVNETMAYVVGISFGRNKLFKRISPKKSWEGAIGGGVFCFVAAYVLSLFFHQAELHDWLIIGGITVIFGTYGDLFESMFKRSINAKDSGSMLPGHGGILDRFDGVFMAAPFVFVYLSLTF